MGKRITCAILIGITTFALTLIGSFNPINLSLTAANETEHTLVLTSEQAPTTSSEFVETATSSGEYSSFTFTNVKAFEGGLCTLNEGGTITKDLASNSLSSIQIAATSNVEFEITTSFTGDFADPYIYSYTANNAKAVIVGNYINIKALAEVNINSVTINYGCEVADDASSGVSLADVDNYITIRNEASAGDNTYIGVKLVSPFELHNEEVTLRNSDNLDELSVYPEFIENHNDGTYTANFDISKLNANNTGKWTSYTYEPRIYVNNKRIDGTTNGLIYKEGRTVDTTSIIVNHGTYDASTCGYKLNVEENSDSNKVVTLSWTNNVKEDTNFTNKGIRFIKMGTEYNAVYEQKLDQDSGTSPVYYYVTGWVATFEEVLMYANNYERFALVDATGVSTVDINAKAEANRCSYEAADGGYKITLAFPLESARKWVFDNAKAESHSFDIIVGLEYNGIPYMFRGDGNTGGLRVAQYSNDNAGTDSFNAAYGKGYDWVTHDLSNFWNWSKITLNHVGF